MEALGDIIILGIASVVPKRITLALSLIFGHRIFKDNVEADNYTWKFFEPQWVKTAFDLVRAGIIAIPVVFAVAAPKPGIDGHRLIARTTVGTGKEEPHAMIEVPSFTRDLEITP